MVNSTKIYTDGGARGNPGFGAAAFVVLEDGEVIYKGSKFLGTVTNNEAEYTGVIIALEWLRKNITKYLGGEVGFFLDSQLVVQQLNGFYKIKSDNLKSLFTKIKNLTLDLRGVEINYFSIRREENKLADKLVNLKLDENL